MGQVAKLEDSELNTTVADILAEEPGSQAARQADKFIGGFTHTTTALKAMIAWLDEAEAHEAANILRATLPAFAAEEAKYL